MPDTASGSTQPPGYQRFFAELKRRKVFRVMAVYGVLGFGLLQILDLVVPALLLPEWTSRLAAVLLLLGFPVAIGVTWAFEATGEGLKRHEAADLDEIRQIIAAPMSRRWPAGMLALAGGGLLLYGAWHMGRTSAVGTADAASAAGARALGADGTTAVVTSIAVLPFANMSPDRDQEYFADGISEELLNLLAHVPALQVAARTSSFAFKGENVGIREIARQLGVEHVLEGSVRKSGDQVRITAQLIRAQDGFHLWSETWDRQLEDIFAIQDEIASDVARQLEVTLLGVTPAVEREVDPEAYSLYLQARHLTRIGTAESLATADELLGRALAIDSSYADAWVAVTGVRLGQQLNGDLSQAETERQILDATRRALEADPNHASAYATLGLVGAFLQNDPAGAAHHYQRALELDPTDLAVLHRSGGLLASIGRFQEAESVAGLLVERDPVNPGVHAFLGNVLTWAGRYDEAIASGRRALSLSPSIVAVHYDVAIALLLKGEPAAALAEVAPEPDEEYRVKVTAMAHYSLGNAREHEEAFRELREKWGEVWPSEIAQVYAWKGEADAAFEWLERAIVQNEDGLDQQHLHSVYDRIRTDPRWQTFLETTGTSPEQLAAIEFEVPLPQ